jgi:hypothetical protein
LLSRGLREPFEVVPLASVEILSPPTDASPVSDQFSTAVKPGPIEQQVYSEGVTTVGTISPADSVAESPLLPISRHLTNSTQTIASGVFVTKQPSKKITLNHGTESGHLSSRQINYSKTSVQGYIFDETLDQNCEQHLREQFE